MKRIAILQSNYIPWKGYFDLISNVDELIIYDDVQYTRRDWRNRNQIKTANGPLWLTVPVKSKGKYLQRINETEIDGEEWSRKHWNTITNSYAKSEHFHEICDLLTPYYEAPEKMLSQQNLVLLEAINNYLGIKTAIRRSEEFPVDGRKSDRLIALCEAVGARCYVSGPAAKVYLEEEKFSQSGIAVEWFRYEGYPEYLQLWGEFVHNISVIDVLFNLGKRAGEAVFCGGSR